MAILLYVQAFAGIGEECWVADLLLLSNYVFLVRLAKICVR